MLLKHPIIWYITNQKDPVIEIAMPYESSKLKILASAITISSALFGAINNAWATPRSEALCKQAAKEGMALESREEALKHIDQALSIDPKSAYYWHVKAAILQGLEESEKALPCLDKSLQLGYKTAGSCILRAYILTDLGRFEEALKATDQALELNPKAEIIHMKARIFQRQGKLDLAEKELDKVIKANANDMLARMQRSTVAVLAKHWPKSIADLSFLISKSTKKSPSYYHYLLARAGAYTETKQYDKAIADCKEGVRDQPNMRQFHSALLKVYILNGNKAGADSERKEITAIDEDFRPGENFGL
jgi:tetratricopeptide (TPR) repeat protein